MKLDDLLRAAFAAGAAAAPAGDDVAFARWVATVDVASTRDVLDLADKIGALWREQYGVSGPRWTSSPAWTISPAEVRWRKLLEPLADKTRNP